MTIFWKPAGEWSGATVAVMGSGPSLTDEVAEALRAHKVIAVNWACALAPWADMLVAVDGDWPAEWRKFAGVRVTATQSEDLDAFYIGHRSERVQVNGAQVEIRNSGLAAIRIAAEMGAARIILVGFDPDAAPHVGLREGLLALLAELRAAGVTVERYGSSDYAEWFPLMLEQVMSACAEVTKVENA